MRQLVIGGDGLIGSAVRCELERQKANFAATSRKPDARLRFDLMLDAPAILPDAEIVYLIAGMPTFLACETDRNSWRVNVDGIIAAARRFPLSFLVYVSSDAVEWCASTGLARQKAAVEAYLLHREAAIVRPSRVVPHTAPLFAQFLVGLGNAAMPGVYRWTA